MCGMLIPILLSAQTNKKLEKIGEYLEHLYKNDVFMGAVCISQKGEVVFSRAYGSAQMEAGEGVGEAATSSTLYRIGSITKTFTSVMTFQLIEEGKLELSDPVSKFFPGIPNGDEITVQHLLGHSSGLFNFTNDPRYSQSMTEPRTHEEMLNLIAKYDPVFEPGERHEYSNSNYVLLGYMIEKLTDMSYDEALQKRICTKLELENTSYGGKPGPREAMSFARVEGNWEEERITDMTVPHGAGALISTSEDLVKFIEGLYAMKLVESSSLEQMMTIEKGYGMGLFESPFNEKKSYGHSGGIDGFVSNLGYFPEEKLAFSVCTNGLDYGMNQILIGILSLYFEEPFTFPNFTTVELEEKVLKKYEGNYICEEIGMEVKMEIVDGVLVAEATGQMPISLTAGSETNFRNNQIQGVFDFLPNEKGECDSFILKQGGMEATFLRKK